MKTKLRRTGTGITEREELDCSWLLSEDKPEERADRVAFALAANRISLNWYEERQAWAKSALQDCGLPSSFGIYRKDDGGNWISDKQFAAKDLAISKYVYNPIGKKFPRVSFDERYTSLTEIAAQAFGVDSTAHFAARILQTISILETCRKIGNRAGAEWSSFRLGEIWNQLGVKKEWEDHALFGQKRRLGLNELQARGTNVRVAKARIWHGLARQAATEIWQQSPQLSVSAVARHVRRRLSDRPSISLPSTDRPIRDVIKNAAAEKVGSTN